MQIYTAFECYYNGCDEFRQLYKLFKDELDAFMWTEEVPTPEWVLAVLPAD